MRMPVPLLCVVFCCAGVSPALPANPDHLSAVELPQSAAADLTSPHGELSLDQAVNLALQLNPTMAARKSAIHAAEERVNQAGLLPNPELDLEAENFGGRGAFDSFDAAERTATISQPILLGGKRKKRRASAASERVLARRDLEAVRLDVTASTTAAFYEVLVAQQREALGIELLDLAESFAHTVQVRVEAGKVSPVEATRARIEVGQARARRARAARELKAARAGLAAKWGSRAPTFDQAVGELPAPTMAPPLEQLRSALLETPEVTRLDDQIQRQRRMLEMEESLRVPDLTVSVGRRRFEEVGQSAWIAAVSLPIPIFDRNQGARRAAMFELERAQLDAAAVRIALDAELGAANQRFEAAVQEATIANEEIVPAANAAFAAVERGYREGKFGFLDLLDAQRTLFDARSLWLDSHEEYLLSRTQLERLVGRTLTSLTNVAPNDREAARGE